MALGRLDGVWLPARLSSPIHYQVWWCHSGTTCTYLYSHIHMHAHTETQWHPPHTWKERGSVTHWCTRTPLKYYQKPICSHTHSGWTVKYLHMLENSNMHHRHVHAATTVYTHTHTVNEKQDSCECLARVWSFPQINVSRLQGSREAHISTQY